MPMLIRRTTGWRRSNMNQGLKGSRQPEAHRRPKLGGAQAGGSGGGQAVDGCLLAPMPLQRGFHLLQRAACADCCSGPSCPIGRPLVRRSDTEPLEIDSRRRHGDFTRNRPGSPTPPPQLRLASAVPANNSAD